MNETKIDKLDYIVAALYLLAGGFIWFAYKYTVFPQENINETLLILTFIGPITLFLMYYKRLRIPIVSLLWCGIGLLQWVFVNNLVDNRDFNAVVGSYAESGPNLLVMVVVFTVIRWLSLLVTKQEFMVAAWFSPRDNRKLNYLDYFFTFACLIVLTVILTAL